MSEQRSPTQQTPTPSHQSIQHVGKNATQVGGNYTQTTSVNLNLVISIFFISILALGGIAWALNVGIKSQGNANSTEPVENVEQ